jgi:dolichol-phosphate mannosyltransferase
VSRAGEVQTSKIIRWFNFNAVGAIGIFVQLGVLSILTSGMHVNYLAATALSVEFAVLHNFFWHERFTWRDRTRSNGCRILTRLLKFSLTTGVFSIAGNLALMRLFVGALGINYFIANLLTIATCSVVNFMVSDQIVFRRGDDQSLIVAAVSSDQQIGNRGLS